MVPELGNVGVVKVLVLGASRSGKTCLINRLVGCEVREDNYWPTIERCSSTIITKSGFPEIQLRITELGGSERILYKLYASMHDLVIVTVVSSQIESLHHAKFIIEKVQSLDSKQEKPLLIAMTKSDQDNPQTSLTSYSLSKLHTCVQVSALFETGIDQLKESLLSHVLPEPKQPFLASQIKELITPCICAEKKAEKPRKKSLVDERQRKKSIGILQKLVVNLGPVAEIPVLQAAAVSSTTKEDLKKIYKHAPPGHVKTLSDDTIFFKDSPIPTRRPGASSLKKILSVPPIVFEQPISDNWIDRIQRNLSFLQ